MSFIVSTACSYLWQNKMYFCWYISYISFWIYESLLLHHAKLEAQRAIRVYFCWRRKNREVQLLADFSNTTVQHLTVLSLLRGLMPRCLFRTGLACSFLQRGQSHVAVQWRQWVARHFFVLRCVSLLLRVSKPIVRDIRTNWEIWKLEMMTWLRTTRWRTNQWIHLFGWVLCRAL